MSRTLRIPGRVGDLAALLDPPEAPADGSPTGTALLAHCFTCGKDLRTTARVARGLAAAGWAVLRVDFAGIGGSEGDFGTDTTFTGDVDDLVRAADLLREEYTAPSLLVGHSLGGAAVLAAAHRIPEVAAVATIAAPFSPEGLVRHREGGARDGGVSDDGSVALDVGGHRVRVGQQLFDDLAAHDHAACLAGLDRPLLALHGTDDGVVPLADARRLRDAVGDRASLVVLDGADHLLSRPADLRRAVDVIAAWAGPYRAGGPTDVG